MCRKQLFKQNLLKIAPIFYLRRLIFQKFPVRASLQTSQKAHVHIFSKLLHPVQIISASSQPPHYYFYNYASGYLQSYTIVLYHRFTRQRLALIWSIFYYKHSSQFRCLLLLQVLLFTIATKMCHKNIANQWFCVGQCWLHEFDTQQMVNVGNYWIHIPRVGLK